MPTIQADATLLHRALENLVLNAMDAMPAGGVLMLRTQHTPTEVSLEVSDTGTGLTPEESSASLRPITPPSSTAPDSASPSCRP